MAEVEFESENQGKMLYSKWQPSNDMPGMVRWLIGKGIVKNQAQANILLIVIAIVAFLLSLYFFFFAGPRPAPVSSQLVPIAPMATPQP